MSGLPGPWMGWGGVTRDPPPLVAPPIQYVVGFLFADIRHSPWVLLLRKKRPAWQLGRLNGPGGKVEVGETFKEAMFREFVEEVEYPVMLDDWRQFALLRGVEKDGKPYEVAFFRADAPESEWLHVIHPSLEYDEKPEWWPVDPLPREALNSLRYLLPMANPVQHDAWPFLIVEGQPNPQDYSEQPVADATGQP